MIGAVSASIFGSLILMDLTRLNWAFTLLVRFIAAEVSLQTSFAPFRGFPPLANIFLAGTIGCGRMVPLLRQDQPFAGGLTPALGITLFSYLWANVSLI